MRRYFHTLILTGEFNITEVLSFIITLADLKLGRLPCWEIVLLLLMFFIMSTQCLNTVTRKVVEADHKVYQLRSILGRDTIDIFFLLLLIYGTGIWQLLKLDKCLPHHHQRSCFSIRLKVIKEIWPWELNRYHILSIAVSIDLNLQRLLLFAQSDPEFHLGHRNVLIILGNILSW